MLGKRNSAFIVLIALMLCTVFLLPVYAEEEIEETTSYFFNDFEEYETEKVFIPVYESNTSSVVVYFVQEFSGNAGSTNPTIKKGEKHPFYENGLASALDADLYPRPAAYFNQINGNYHYKYIDRSKYVYGGLPGYEAFDSINAFPLWYGASSRPNRANVDNLTVVKNEETNNNELVLNPMMLSDNQRELTGYSAFGKEKLNLIGRKNLIQLDVRIDNQTNADAFRLSIAKNTDFANVTSWKNYGWMNYNNQFYYNKGSAWVDVLTFKDGKIYLGDVGTISNLNQDNVVCNYNVGKYYSIKYYLNLEDISNPLNMVMIYDDSGNLVGEKSAKIVLTEKTTTTINNDTYFEGKIDGATESTNRGPTYNTFFKSFDQGSNYALFATYATAVGKKTMMDAKAVIDNFGLDASDIAGLEITTDKNNYLENPISFIGEQKIEMEFNVDLLSDIENGLVTVTDASGNVVTDKDGNKAKIKLIDNKKAEITLPDGLLAASNYYVNFSKDIASAMGNLGEDKSFAVRTMDVFNINKVELAGTTLNASISNNSTDPKKLIMLAAVKDNDKLIGNKVYYKAVYIDKNATKEFSISDITVPSKAKVQVYFIDGFGTLKAFSDMLIAQ